MEKSSIFLSKNMTSSMKRKIRSIGLKEVHNNTIYLGNFLIIGRSKVCEFGRLKDKVHACLENWKNILLSKVGKVTLIKSVIEAVSTYTMSTFKIPLCVCKELDSIACRFWWGVEEEKSEFLTLKSWRTIYLPKEKGRLGLKCTRDVNISLLAKLAWKMVAGENSF